MINQINMAFWAALAAASVALWILVFRKLAKGIAPLENRKRDPSPLGFLDVLVVFGAVWAVAPSIAFQVLRWMGVSVLGEDTPVEDRSMILLVVSGLQLLATFGCMLFFWLRYRRCSSFGWQKRFWKLDLRTGMIWFVLIVPPVMLVQILASWWIAYSHTTLDTLKESQSSFQIATTWFSAVLVAPIIEEFFFRGILQGWIQRLGNTEPNEFGNLVMGGDFSNQFVSTKGDGVEPGKSLFDSQVFFDSSLRWIPILVSALLFAVVHIGQGGAPYSLFFLAVGLGYLYRQTGSIIPCIVVHVLLNFQTMFWVTLANATNGT